MKIQDLKTISEVEVFPGFFGKLIHSEKMTIAHWRILEKATVPTHHHIHEQVVHVLEGELELIVDGKSHLMNAGSVFVIPSNVPHSAIGITACKVIDTFCPVREDYQF